MEYMVLEVVHNGRSRDRSRQEEKAQLQKQVKQGEYGVCLIGGIVGSGAHCRMIEALILKAWNQQCFPEVECVARLVKELGDIQR